MSDMMAAEDTHPATRYDLLQVEAHLKELIGSNDRRYEQRFRDLQIAVGKAETAAEKRFEGVNEFRDTLSDQQRTLIPRLEAEMRFTNAEDRIGKLELTNSNETGTHAGNRETWAWIIGGVGVLFGVLSFVLNYLKGTLKP